MSTALLFDDQWLWPGLPEATAPIALTMMRQITVRILRRNLMSERLLDLGMPSDPGRLAWACFAWDARIRFAQVATPVQMQKSDEKNAV